MQLSAKVSPHDLEEFFQKVGQVCDVKMISDRNSRRSKGIAYVEFYDENSVLPALALTGQKLVGVPIIVQPTMAEKNRLAAQAQNLKKAEGPRKLYVGSLHYSINESILKTIFEPFGAVDKIQLMRDENGLSKGYAFVEFSDSECAERAFSNMNGVELAGRPLKINNVTERDTTAMEYLDGEDTDIGVGMTPAARAQLMAKLSDGHNAGLAVPQVAGVAAGVPTASPCIMLSNMFDPMSESEPGWENDIRDDVLEECSQAGSVYHIHVDKLSQGNVYVKCSSAQVATAAFNRLNGRFFAGKQIVVQYIPEAAYNIKFPAAQNAFVPLQ
jgi:RNA-binding protein 39